MNFIRDSAIRIPMKYKNELWFTKIVLHLTREQSSYASDSCETKYYYDKTDNELIIPRFYPISKYGHGVVLDVSDGEDITVKSDVKPKDTKQENAINWFINNTEGVLCMKPGEGKTVVAIDSISKIGKKAIVFVHTTPLLEQWIDRICEHTDLTREQIGIISSNSFEKNFSKPIILSTVQSYCSAIKNKGESFLRAAKDANIGIAIWDECHTSVSAEMFSKSSLHTFSRRNYGLSATPVRLDGNTDIITYHLSDVYVPDGNSNTLEPKVIMIYSDFQIDRRYFFRIYQMYLSESSKNRGVFNKGTYLSLMEKSESFKKIIKNVMNQITSKQRHTLVLSERIVLLEECAKHLPKNEYGILSFEDRESVLDKRIILSTFQKGRDGLDVPRLDTLIFLTPPSNIEQATGRVVREYKNKLQPIIIDIVDSGCNEMMKRSKYRKKFYKSKNWVVEERYV